VAREVARQPRENVALPLDGSEREARLLA